MRNESNNLGGAGQLVTAMLAQFTNSDVTIPVWGFILGPSEVCTCTLHTFSTLPSLLLLALLQYKIFSLHPVEGTALLQEYPSFQHRVKIHDFLPLLGVAESKSIINESSPPHSGPRSSLTLCRLYCNCFFQLALYNLLMCVIMIKVVICNFLLIIVPIQRCLPTCKGYGLKVTWH